MQGAAVRSGATALQASAIATTVKTQGPALSDARGGRSKERASIHVAIGRPAVTPGMMTTVAPPFPTGRLRIAKGEAQLPGKRLYGVRRALACPSNRVRLEK